ncbi:hypothetical protein [Pontibacter vulgaris]|uniref:hypothetical protein n=1 Tax=Pontibacter vulgaris TaxID=2905679 RepID=UPI001FA802D0|nr:hypothetical protein [Pontibacter vulgaris]
MEDYKLLLYILAAVAYFLFSAWRKAFKGSGEVMPPNQQPAKEKEMPVKPLRPIAPRTSFEDILRELQPKLERAKEQEAATLEEYKPRQPKPVVNYETITPKAISLEEPADRSVADKKMQESRREAFKPYAIKQQQVSPYAKLLRNPNTAREAFILSEIFQRKYN